MKLKDLKNVIQGKEEVIVYAWSGDDLKTFHNGKFEEIPKELLNKEVFHIHAKRCFKDYRHVFLSISINAI